MGLFTYSWRGPVRTWIADRPSVCERVRGDKTTSGRKFRTYARKVCPPRVAIACALFVATSWRTIRYVDDARFKIQQFLHGSLEIFHRESDSASLCSFLCLHASVTQCKIRADLRLGNRRRSERLREFLPSRRLPNHVQAESW